MISEAEVGDVPGDIAGEGIGQRGVALGHWVAIGLIDEWVDRDNCNDEKNNNVWFRNMRSAGDSIYPWATRGVFLVAVLDVGTIFEAKFQCVGAQNMPFWPVESDF